MAGKVKMLRTTDRDRDARQDEHDRSADGGPAQHSPAIGRGLQRRQTAARENREREFHFHQVSGRDAKEIQDRHGINEFVKMERRVTTKRENDPDGNDRGPKDRARVTLENEGNQRERERREPNV